MEKFLGGVVLGVFVGAVAAELLRKATPNFLDSACRKTRAGFDAVKEEVGTMKTAFVDGYRESTATAETE